jgi:Transposase IS116/IS110/IS902 family
MRRAPALTRRPKGGALRFGKWARSSAFPHHQTRHLSLEIEAHLNVFLLRTPTHQGRSTTSGRHLAAWLGLVPGQRSTGGKERLVGINGARALTRWWRSRSPLLMALLARRPVNVATVALANKIARVIWVVLVRGEVYRTAG